MKIVILDAYTANPGDLSWDVIAKFGDLAVYDRTPADKITERIGDAEIVFTNKTVLTENVLKACPSVRFISVLATGYNVVDTDYAKKAGITVCNVPAYSTDAASQHAIALLLEICNNVGLHSREVRYGKWCGCSDFYFTVKPVIELKGKTMGIIGLWKIGRKTAGTAISLGMNVIASTLSSREMSETDSFRYEETEEVLKESDVIVLHCPLNEETREIINKDTIRMMKDGVILINNGRGPLLNEQDTADALNSGKIYAAGLDVLSTEPPSPDNPLLTARNCYITPHISWASKEARERLIDLSALNLEMYLKGTPVNTVF